MPISIRIKIYFEYIDIISKTAKKSVCSILKMLIQVELFEKLCEEYEQVFDIREVNRYYLYLRKILLQSISEIMNANQSCQNAERRPRCGITQRAAQRRRSEFCCGICRLYFKFNNFVKINIFLTKFCYR